MALLIVNPGFSLCSNPGLKLANAFGVKFKLRHHHLLLCFLCLFAAQVLKLPNWRSYVLSYLR
jgi:hypothetical protein